MAVVLGLEGGILALTGLLVGAFRAAGFRGEAPEPLEAAARIFFLVSADGRFNWDWDLVLVGEGAAFVSLAGFALVGVVFVGLVGLVGFDLTVLAGLARAALTRPVVLTAGSLTVVFAVVVFLVIFLPRTVATAFLTPALIDLAVILRFLGWTGTSESESESELSESDSEALRFFPLLFLGLSSALRFSSSLARCCLSLRRGPRKPRQLADPQRHCCTFLLEYGLNN